MVKRYFREYIHIYSIYAWQAHSQLKAHFEIKGKSSFARFLTLLWAGFFCTVSFLVKKIIIIIDSAGIIPVKYLWPMKFKNGQKGERFDHERNGFVCSIILSISKSTKLYRFSTWKNILSDLNIILWCDDCHQIQTRLQFHSVCYPSGLMRV